MYKRQVLQGYREMGQMLAKDRFTLKEAAMTARRSWQLTLKDVYKRQGVCRCGAGTFNGILRRFSRDVDWPQSIRN